MLTQDIIYDSKVKGWVDYCHTEGPVQQRDPGGVQDLPEKPFHGQGDTVSILGQLIDCCVPEESKRAVQKLLTNETFLYAKPHLS